MPLMASDVFTCGLMLYELLAGEHPYWRGDQGEYAKLVQSYAAKPPALVGLMPASSRIAEVSAAQHRRLSPRPRRQTIRRRAARSVERTQRKAGFARVRRSLPCQCNTRQGKISARCRAPRCFCSPNCGRAHHFESA